MSGKEFYASYPNEVFLPLGSDYAPPGRKFERIEATVAEAVPVVCLEAAPWRGHHDAVERRDGMTVEGWLLRTTDGARRCDYWLHHRHKPHLMLTRLQTECGGLVRAYVYHERYKYAPMLG